MSAPWAGLLPDSPSPSGREKEGWDGSSFSWFKVLKHGIARGDGMKRSGVLGRISEFAELRRLLDFIEALSRR